MLRNPDDIELEWPSAMEVARAIVAAARLEGDDPESVVGGNAATHTRTRTYAVLALAHRFQTISPYDLARLCGQPSGKLKSIVIAAQQGALGNNNWKWFDLDRLNAVNEACGWPAMTSRDSQEAPQVLRVLEERERRAKARAQDRGEDGAVSAPPVAPVQGAEDPVCAVDLTRAPILSEPLGVVKEDDRIARVERMKAFAAGDPPAAPAVEEPWVGLARNWTKEQDAELTRRIADGESLSQIAARMGITKGSAVGRSRRLGLQKEARPVTKPKPAPPPLAVQTYVPPKTDARGAPVNVPGDERLASNLSANLLGRQAVAQFEPESEAIVLAKFDPLPGAPGAILALKNNECRWPIGDVMSPDFRFCCTLVAPGTEPRYCDVHTKASRSDRTSTRSVAHV